MNNKGTRYALRHYLLGALPARLGDEMSGQAILLMGIAAGSAVLGSTLLACLTFAAAIGGPLLGTLLDRSSHPGRVLATALGLYAIGLASIALSLGHILHWLSLVLALVAGFFMPAISGGWSSRLKSFIADEHMTRASAIDATTFNIAGLAGPALAGLVAAWLGVGWAIVVLVGLLVAALPMAWSLPKPNAQAMNRTESFLQDVMAGFKVIIINRLLLRITLTSVISYLGVGMLWVVCPLIGKNILGNAGYGGVLLSVLSVGALITAIAYAKWPSKRSPDMIAFVTTLILAVAMFVLAFADNFFVALLVMLIAGAADGPQLAAIFAVRHREAPERSRSQVFTTGASLKITAAAIGALLAGHFAAKSLGFTIVTAGLVQLAAAASFAISSLLFQFESARIECSMSASMEFTDPKLVTIYDAVNPIDDKIGFFVELAQTLHAKKIIDLGCGTGLLSHELAKDGHMVIGVEPAAAMIEQAKHKYGNEAQWIVGGSEKLDASMQGDMVIMTGHVAQFFLEDEGWVQALQNIHRAIKPGGYLVFESRNPEVRPFADWPTSDHHDRITNTPLGPVEWWSDGLVTADGFAKYTLHYLFSDTSEEIVSDNKLCFRTFEALQASLENAGFEVEKVYGDWNSSPFESHSPEMIFIAKAL